MVILDIIGYFPKEFPMLQTFLSALVSFLLGIIWYNPKIMGEKIINEHRAEIQSFKPALYHYLIAGGLWIITACIYSFLVGFLTPPAISAMLGLSTFLWVGFVLPAVMLNGMFSGKKLIVIAVDSSYFLAALYVMAVIHDVL